MITAPGPVFHGADAIRAAVGWEDLVDPVHAALVSFSRGLGDSPVAVFAPGGSQGDVHVKSAWLPGHAVFVVKVATWFAERARRGGTPGSGVVAVFDAATGDLSALLEDEHHLSDIRTAAAGALAARVLSRPDATVLTVLGSGVQAYLQTLAAAAQRPLREVRLWGRTPQALHRLSTAIEARRPDLQVRIVDDLRPACSGADLIVTATSSTEPLVQADWLTPGTHITAVGADDPAKTELTGACLDRADRLVVDSRALAAVHGDLARAGTRRNDIAELGELLDGIAPGRQDPEEITICKLIGLGVQDLAAAEVTLRHLEAGPHCRGRTAGPSDPHPPASAADLTRPGPPTMG